MSYNLQKEGFEVYTAGDGEKGIDVARREDPDLILLDVMMPNMDGMEVCSKLRQEPQFKETLIVFLTARGENYSQLAGFEVGADDYITKPITPRLLIARVKALLKRAGVEEEEAILTVGPLRMDREKMLVYKDDQLIPLPGIQLAEPPRLQAGPGLSSKGDLPNTVGP